MKKRLQEVEGKLANGDEMDKNDPSTPTPTPTNGATTIPVPASGIADVDAAIQESDARSVYVGNVRI